MAANYMTLPNGLENYPEILDGGDGLGLFAVGNSALVEPTVDQAFRPLYPPPWPNFSSDTLPPIINDNNSPTTLAHSSTGEIGQPGAIAGNNHPTFADNAFGAPLAPLTTNSFPGFFPGLFLPWRDFATTSALPLSSSLPPPTSGVVHSGTAFGGFVADGSQMTDRNQSSFVHLPEDGAFQSFSESSNSAGLAGAGTCPFAPPRHNHNLEHHQTFTTQQPQSTQSSSSSVNRQTNGSFYPGFDSHPNLPQLPPQLLTFQNPATCELARPVCGGEPYSDDFLSALAGDFSSPSLPSVNSSPHHSVATAPSQSVNHSSFSPSTPRHIDDNMPAPRPSVSRTAASSRTRRSSRSSVASANMVDLTSPKTERESEPPSGIDIDLGTPMAPPPTRKRSRATANATTPRATSRRPSASLNGPRVVKPLKTSRKQSLVDDDAFETSSVLGKDDDDDVLDLTGADEVPADLLKPKVDNRTKLSKFQCVICMDDVSNLTVTHCGHMFCSECLHSALHIDSMKKTCPVCRTKVDVKNKPGAKQGKNSYFHLELKLMTANRKGKQPAGKFA